MDVSNGIAKRFIWVQRTGCRTFSTTLREKGLLHGRQRKGGKEKSIVILLPFPFPSLLPLLPTFFSREPLTSRPEAIHRPQPKANNNGMQRQGVLPLSASAPMPRCALASRLPHPPPVAVAVARSRLHSMPDRAPVFQL